MIPLSELTFIGSGLARPECVLATASGDLYASDWRGGVTWIRPGGKQVSILAKDAPLEVKPNGIALMPDGGFLLAHLGATDGGVYRLTRDGDLEPFVTDLEGQPLPPTNFPSIDAGGRVWITVSTCQQPRSLGYNADVSDGYILLKPLDDEARVVADGLGYTNECHVDPSGQWLYVNETFARRLTRFRIGDLGDLQERQTVAEFGKGTYPDGLAFDREGGVWVTSIVSNRVIRVDPSGEQQIILEDCDPGHVDWVEEAFLAGEMGRPHLDQVKSRVLGNISSLAFGGKDLRTCYLGCLLGDRIASFRSPVAGAPPVHWDVIP